MELPRHEWPDSWKSESFRRPIVPLIKALYGHPLAGVRWEEHCHRALREAGFEAIHGWGRLYWHRAFCAILSVYVGGFGRAGNVELLLKAWAAEYPRCGQKPTLLPSGEA